MRKTVTSGSSVKALIMRSRCSIDMLPFNTTHFTPTCFTDNQRVMGNCFAIERDIAALPGCMGSSL